MLIVFEGIDGSGKDTQISMLLSFFHQHSVRYKLHKYPTRKAVDALAHLSGDKTVPPERLAKIFAHDIESERKRIEEEIAAGFVVVCDRYLHSTLAYQGVGAGYAKLKLELEGYGLNTPELVLLMDIGAFAAAKRKESQKEPDRHEKDVGFLAKVRENYLQMEREGFLSYKYAIVDASKPKDEVFTHVLAQVEPLIVKKMER